MKTPAPRKGIASYLLPFLLIVALLGSGWYILQNKVNLDDLRRILQPPSVAKDEKISLVYQEGENQLKPWNDENWKVLGTEEYLQAGDVLKTSSSGVVVIRFFEGSEIRLGKSTEIKIIRADKNVTEGDHVAVEITSGQLWRRGTNANTENGDFIITTNRQIVRMNTAAVVDVSTNPDRLRVIGGKVMSNVAEKMGGTRKPISQLEVTSGQQLTLDDLTLDQLKAGEKKVIASIDDAYLQSEWYLWNMEKEEKLGHVVEFTPAAVEPKVELEKLETGLVVVTTPKAKQKVGSKLLVTGTYDKEKISRIWVNNAATTLGLENEWEASVQLSEQSPVITVTAQEKESEAKKEVASFEVQVDSTGPGLGKIIQPPVDENGNGVITGETIELIGEVDADAQKVCVAHNETVEPYCLKQYVPGSKKWRYAGGVGYGNVVTGKNKYTIYAYDSFDNATQKTVYYFKDIPKPSEKVDEPTFSVPTAAEEPLTNSISKPVITSPDPNVALETSSPTLKLTGTVDPKSTSLLINERKAPYTAGSGTFEVTITLDSGENLIKIQSVDSKGNKSKTATLNAIYLEEEKKPVGNAGTEKQVQ